MDLLQFTKITARKANAMCEDDEPRRNRGSCAGRMRFSRTIQTNEHKLRWPFEFRICHQPCHQPFPCQKMNYRRLGCTPQWVKYSLHALGETGARGGGKGFCLNNSKSSTACPIRITSKANKISFGFQVSLMLYWAKIAPHSDRASNKRWRHPQT